jgi:hypothetical protein
MEPTGASGWHVERPKDTRRAVVVTIALLWIGFVFVVLWLQGGGGVGPVGFILRLLLFSVLPAVVCWRRLRDQPWVALAGIVSVIVASTLATSVIVFVGPYSAGTLSKAIRRVAPPSFQFVMESDGGNSLCFDECPSVFRLYHTPSDVPAARAEALAALRRHGCSRITSASDGQVIARCGRVHVSANFAPDDGRTGLTGVVYDARA